MISIESATLIIWSITVIVTIYINNRILKHNFSKEQYFNYQKILEKIINKLLEIETLNTKITKLIKKHQETKDVINIIDVNNTFEHLKNSNKNVWEVASLIQIYFPSARDDWNECIDLMWHLWTIYLNLKEETSKEEKINREKYNNFEEISYKLTEKVELFTLSLIETIKKFKKTNL